ncbi:translation initiation factor SUI1 [Microdochium trichocladiopsis]|uniref:Translation machinery-associated protein 22 n=1 Tax=Microdochium trichocladiopsis TaxID=1682393 RepID=A0A9P8Y7B9_9PEZI|nr:translation initiation factor SUI1 [Microdochium trichocladiopsis]KAH7031614.1 translation initiation factor SUI1 [Microdochium trichocladiopsis]
MADVEQPSEPQGRIVTYCGVCTLPPEYCEYGGTVRKCQEWLQTTHSDLYAQIWSAGTILLLPKPARRFPTSLLPKYKSFRQSWTDKTNHSPSANPDLASLSLRQTEALEAATASLSVEAQKRAAKDAQKKTAQAEKAEQKHADKVANSVVTIKRIERNKRKYVTAVSGLEAFNLDLKKVAKEFGKKFATGSSLTRAPGGGEEIVVQGDVSPEIEEFLLEKYKEIPEDNIELVDDKKLKKKAAAAAASAGTSA